MATEAQRNACKRYYERTKKTHRVIVLRFDKRKDGDVISALEASPNKTQYVRDLVRGDISG